MKLIQPKGSTLRLVKLRHGTELSAAFSGHVWVSGTFVGRWPTGATDRQFKAPEYIIVPDPEGTAALPYFYLRDPPYAHRYRVVNIQITNGVAALRRAVGEKAARRLLERRVGRVRATGTFLVEGYSVGIECDAPWARARLVRSQLPDQVAVRHRVVPEGC